MNWILAGLIMSLPIGIGELLVKRFKRKEDARKFVHISAGLCAASLPILLDLNQIAILALVFTPPMIIAKKKSLMASMSGVKRRTYGEILFSIGVASVAFWVQRVEMYLFGILVMALSDGFASVVGSRFGKKKFKIFIAEKSYIGSLAFFLITLAVGIVLIAAYELGYEHIGVLLLISAAITLEEASLPYGLDNLFVPLIAALLFSVFIV